MVAVNSEIFAKRVKRHICEVKNSELEHDLPTLVNSRLILSYFLLRNAGNKVNAF